MISAKPCAVPRRNTVKGELVKSSEPSTSCSLPSLSFKRGILLNRARHMASKMVDLPAPVFPTMAIKPAEAKGSDSKSIKCSPARDAKFFSRIDKIFMANP